MSTPDQAGPGRPARLAGLGLLALAAIALVIGLISWIGGGSPDNNAGQPPASSGSNTPPPASTQPSPGSSSSPSSSSETPPPAPPSSSVQPPAPTSSVAPPPQPPQQPAHTQPVRVLNNSFIEKLADRAAADFRNAGYNVTEVGNYPGGKIAVPTVYFRPGTDEEGDARALGKDFGMRVEPRFEGIKDASPGIIVIVTKDYSPRSK
ncbi:LytR C-terminal domain-containing protein [Actinocrispum sp. NPDC049592]|uniref:LytR C-terminal domain-containing protein n=1 Tax=Actinocrispum sp. NPDC049592 TaxID=3154835 RepID=UPI00342BEDBF